MELKSKYVAIVDYDESSIQRRDVTNELNDYIEELHNTISNSVKVQYFEVIDTSTQVISTVIDIIREIHFNPLNHNEKEMLSAVNQYKDIISERLRLKESQVQKKIEHMSNVKKGSLLQVLFKEPHSEVYEFLISKTEHNVYMDEDTYNLREGFRIDKKNLWKSCIIRCYIDEDEVKITEIRVYLDNKSVYWHKEFLEVNKLRNDEENTSAAFRNIDNILKSELAGKEYNKDNVKDYDILKKSIYSYMTTKEQFDYDSILNEIIYVYPYEGLNEEEKSKFFTKMEKLPKNNKFDTQFDLDHKSINIKDLKTIIEVNSDIEIITKSVDAVDSIFYEVDNFGVTYLMIKTTNKSVRTRFKRRK